MDIPENVVYSNPDGRFVHTGLGLVVSHKFSETSDLGLRLVAGVLLGRLDVDGYRFGDGFVILGLALRDRKTHLEIDVGTIFSYSKFESLRHEGVDDVLLI